jgi:hypothetical protein
MKSIPKYPLLWLQNEFLVFQIVECYQYTSTAPVIKLLSFWDHWYHITLLVCCRLQELMIFNCEKMTDGGLLEGIGSLHELASLRFTGGHNLTAQALSQFLLRPSMTSIVSLELSDCYNLDDEGMKQIAERCNRLTFTTKCSGLYSTWSASVCVWGCDVSLSFCLYLQMYTFEDTDSLWLVWVICCTFWNEVPYRTLHSRRLANES